MKELAKYEQVGLSSDGDFGQDAFDWMGNWWLPDNSNVKVPGVLRLTEKGPSLELFGSFQSSDGTKDEPIAIVHGTTPKAQYVTLQSLRETGRTTDARGQYRTRYGVELAVTGEHFPSPEQVMFQHLEIQYSTLVHWVSHPIISEKTLEQGGLTFNISTSPPITGRIHQGKDFNLGLYYGACYESAFSGRFLNVYPGAHITLHWDAPRSISDALSTINSVRDFLAFATYMPTRVERVNAQPVRFTEIGHSHDMQLFHKQFSMPKVKRDPFFSLFSMEDVLSNIDAVLGAWFKNGKTLQPIIDLHLASTLNPDMQIESQFMAEVQAIEAFHRRMRDNKDVPEAEHEARIEEIVKAAPERHQDWLKRRLSYSNEPGLKRRLKDLFNEYACVLEHFKPERDAFCKSVFYTRNYLTHYDQRLEEKAAKGWNLQLLVYGLQLLMDICLLDACGIDRKEIPRLAARRHMLLAKPSAAKLAGAIENACVTIDRNLNVTIAAQDKAT